MNNNDILAWTFAILFFVCGDIITTFIGLTLPGIIEGNIFPSFLLEHTTYGFLIFLKLVVTGVFYVLYRIVPDRHAIGVPLGLAIIGFFATGWNIVIISFVMGY